MNKDTRFSPLFKTPNRMKKPLSGDDTRNTQLVLKILTGFLCLVLIAQIYHKRRWFMNIPKQPVAGQVQASSPDTLAADTSSAAVDISPAPETSDTLLEEKPGVFSRLASLFGRAPKPEPDEIFLLDAPLDSLSRNLGLEKSAVRRKIKDVPKYYVEERLQVPKGRPLPEYALILTRLALSRGLQVQDAWETEKDSSITLDIWGASKMVRRLRLCYGPFYLPGYARMAIVLENFGDAFTPEISSLFSGIRRPVTLGLVPQRPFTDKIYRMALQNGFEILCQIPMETIPFRDLGEKAVYKQSDRKKIEALLTDFSRAMPEARGSAIYGGGIRIVENEPEILKTVLAHVKSEDKYFIDNSFASRSKVEEFTRELGVTALPPLGCADAEGGTDGGREAMLRFAELVRKTGKGIVLFRDGAGAGRALEEALPVIESYGIKIVTVSSLFK